MRKMYRPKFCFVCMLSGGREAGTFSPLWPGKPKMRVRDQNSSSGWEREGKCHPAKREKEKERKYTTIRCDAVDEQGEQEWIGFSFVVANASFSGLLGRLKHVVVAALSCRRIVAWFGWASWVALSASVPPPLLLLFTAGHLRPAADPPPSALPYFPPPIPAAPALWYSTPPFLLLPPFPFPR